MKYKRILLKLSGETLGGPEGRGLDDADDTGPCQDAMPVAGRLARGRQDPEYQNNRKNRSVKNG